MVDMLVSQLPLWSERDGSHAWVVRESRRARRLSVRVFHTGRVEVIVPSRTSPSAVERFVNSHRGWIERKRSEARTRALPVGPFPPARIELAASSETWNVRTTPESTASGNRGLRARVRLTVQENGLLLTGDCSNIPAIGRALRRWLLVRAGEVLEPALRRTANELGFRYKRALVRRQRTRWGSCSARGTISLNCCLLFQRPEVVRYLLIHELAHTTHLNHSRRFWQAVAKHCPDYRTLDRELLDGWRRVPSWVFSDEDRLQ